MKEENTDNIEERFVCLFLKNFLNLNRKKCILNAFDPN